MLHFDWNLMDKRTFCANIITNCKCRFFFCAFCPAAHSITKMCIMNEHVLVADHFRFLVYQSYDVVVTHTDCCLFFFFKLQFDNVIESFDSLCFSYGNVFWMRKQHVTTVFLVALRWWPRERKNTAQKKKLRSRRQIGDESSVFFSLHSAYVERVAIARIFLPNGILMRRLW